MALKLFRCDRPTCKVQDKGHFRAELPKCPRCGLEANDPKFGSKIIRLTMIHYDPPTEFPGIGKGFRACSPTKMIQVTDGPGGAPKNPFDAGTGDVNQVSCPECKLTDEYKAGLAALNDDDGPCAALELLESRRTS